MGAELSWGQGLPWGQQLYMLLYVSGFAMVSAHVANRLAATFIPLNLFIMLSVSVLSSLWQVHHAFFILSLQELANEREYEFRVFSVFRGSQSRYAPRPWGMQPNTSFLRFLMF